MHLFLFSPCFANDYPHRRRRLIVGCNDRGCVMCRLVNEAGPEGRKRSRRICHGFACRKDDSDTEKPFGFSVLSTSSGKSCPSNTRPVFGQPIHCNKPNHGPRRFAEQIGACHFFLPNIMIDTMV